MHSALCCTHWRASKGLEIPVRACNEDPCQGLTSGLEVKPLLRLA